MELESGYICGKNLFTMMNAKAISGLLSACSLLLTTAAMAQGVISGTVVDGADNQSLPGASVVIKGTQTGTTTDFNGRFRIRAERDIGELIISFIGYNAKTVSFSISGGTAYIGQIVLHPQAVALQEVAVVGRNVIDVADERKTPVAVSTITAAQIQKAPANRQFPDLLAETPSTYVNNGGGGNGDAQIYLRGFDQSNTAVLINGQPINGMEDGKVYWSNWSGIRDVASSIQIQRGLGASELAISSVGGTINIVTQATERKRGGAVNYSTGRDNFHKITSSYSTGLNEGGWGFSALLSREQGDGYSNGTGFVSYSYFVSLGYKPSDKHRFNFMIFGAPQHHDQNFRQPIATLLKYGKKHNGNYGYRNGRYLTERRNFYHKPVANFNWDWNMDKNLSLSTVLYASWGRGGGTGPYAGRHVYAVRDDKTGLIDWGATAERNRGIAPTAIGDKKYIVGSKENGAYLLRSSINRHNWYGLLSSLGYAHAHWSIDGGMDLRTYTGYHFRAVNDFLDLSGWRESTTARPDGFYVFQTYKSNAFDTRVRASDRINYDYKEQIDYGGLFGQVEYSDDVFSAFIQVAGSNQSHVRWDYANYLTPDAQKSDRIDNWGGDVKGGLHVKLGNRHSVFANVGYYARQPFQDNLFLNYKNDVNPLANNEKITGMELGYRFKGSHFGVDVNLYNTIWADRTITKGFYNHEVESEGGLRKKTDGFTNESGIREIHRGAEVDLRAYPTPGLILKGFFSYGDWKYDENVQSQTFDADLKPVKPIDRGGSVIDDNTLYLADKKVPNAAQLTLGMGLDYNIFKGLHALANWKYNGDLYADYRPSDFLGAGNKNKTQIKLPDYNIMDAGLYYDLPLSDGRSLTFRLNIDNLWDVSYFSNMSGNNPVGTSEGTLTTYKGIDVSNRVYWGLGRRWSAGVSFRF